MVHPIYKIIQEKQLGNKNTKDDIDYLINRFTIGEIPDYQMSAWLMAIYFKGMNKN